MIQRWPRLVREVSQGFPFHNGALVSGQHLQGSLPSASVNDQHPFLLPVRGTESCMVTLCCLHTGSERSCAELQYQAFDIWWVHSPGSASCPHRSIVLAEYAWSLGTTERAWLLLLVHLLVSDAASYHTWRATKCSCTTGKGRRHTCPSIVGIAGMEGR